MLQSISIQNFAIIESLIVDFKNGMSVLTGETGAGKSIIIDAVALLAGGRSSSTFVRHGSDKAVLQGLFDLDHAPSVQQLLDELSIPNEENQLLVYREIHANGKGVIRINGLLSTANVLKQLTRTLIDIHGQHEHQQLMDDTHHLNLLDQFGNTDVFMVLEAYQMAYAEYAQARKQLKSLMVSQAQDDQKVSLLKQHIKDIEAVAPQEGEAEALKKELTLLLQHEKYAKALHVVDKALSNEEHGALMQINQAVASLQLLEESSCVEKTTDLIGALETIKDVSKFVGSMLEKHQFDLARFEFVQHRLSQYDNLSEKYGDVLSYYQTAKAELDTIDNKETYLAQAQEAFIRARENVLENGRKLTHVRQEKAVELSRTILEQLNDLYMKNVQFEAVFLESDKPKITANGLDDVTFMVSTNTGEPLKPLAKVASGGELSRLMLALKVIFSKQQGIGTLIFDEIDTGVSGRVAQSIAEKMYAIGTFAQVLSVSHLPQVAAIADHHLFVSKLSEADRTKTTITYLEHQERVVEVAKMFAGEDVNESALHHAELLVKK